MTTQTRLTPATATIRQSVTHRGAVLASLLLVVLCMVVTWEFPISAVGQSAPSPSASRALTRPLAPAVATAPAVDQCNGTDNVGGQAVACTVTVTNNLDVGTGATSSTVTVKECHGMANAALTCTTSTTPLQPAHHIGHPV